MGSLLKNDFGLIPMCLQTLLHQLQCLFILGGAKGQSLGLAAMPASACLGWSGKM